MASSAAFELVIELQNKASSGLGGLIEQAGAFATGGFIQKGIEAVSGAVTDFVGGAISEASEWQTQLGQLGAVLTSTGGKAGLTKDAILEMNKSLSAGGGFSAAADDAVLQGQNMLLTFTNIGKDVFPDASKAMLDMATKMNGGVTPSAEQLQQTSIQLGKALNDPTKGLTALQKVGVAFTKDQKEQIKAMQDATTVGEAWFGTMGVNMPDGLRELLDGVTDADTAIQKITGSGITMTSEQERMFRSILAGNGTMEAQRLILNELSTEFGGSATAAMDTFAGKQQLLSEQFNNVKQSLGEALMPILSQFMDWLSSPEVQAGIQALVTAVGQFLVGAFNGLMGVVNALQPVIAAVWGFIQSTVIPVAQQVFDTLAKWWTEMQPGIQAAWDAIMSAVRDAWNIIQPLLQTGMEFISNLWNAVWPGIQQTFSGVWQAIQGILQVGWSVISGIWNTVTSILKGDWEGAWNAIKGMFEGVWQGVQTFLGGVWETIKGIWNTGTAYLRTIWENIWNGISSFFTGIWNGISSFVGTAIETVKNIINMKVAEIKVQWEIFWQGVQDFFTNAWNFITTELPKKLGEIWTNITTWVTTTAKDIKDKVLSIGSNIVEGIKNGISGAWDAFVNWVLGMIGGVVDSIKSFLGIKSPSRLLADEVGKPMVAGVQAGWTGGVGNLRATMIGDMDSLVGEARARAEEIQQMMANAAASGSASSAGTGVGIGDTTGGSHSGGNGGIRALGTGGIITRPLSAIVGDGGPEAVVPLDRLERWMGGGRSRQPVVVNINGPVIGTDPKSLARYIQELLYDYAPS